MSEEQSEPPIVRLSVNINEETQAQFEEIRESEADLSLTEVVRRALGIYYYIWKESRSGKEIRTHDPHTGDEVVMELLD